MNYKIKVFKAEKDAGIAEQVKSASSVAYISKLEPLDPATPFAKKLIKSVASETHPVETLYPMKDILVTTGWNINTDVFDNGETWSARNTPVHHPLNMNHNEKNIIGNITASQPVDDKLNVIPEESAVDELPAKFHILNGSVIYKEWEDEIQQELINKTIAEIENGNAEGKPIWYVSMECAFKGFDYAVIRPDGSSAIIPRDANSAFLTKHLRHYGGDGIYRCEGSKQEFKIGRLLRNITFIGKGLVRQPANPESVILNHVSSFTSATADLGYIKSEAEIKPNTTSVITSEENKDKNTETNPMPEITAADVKRLEDRITELVKQNETLATELKNKDGEAAKTEITNLKAELTARDSKITTLESTKTELSNTLATVTQRAEAAEKEAAKLKEEKLEKDRLALLASKGASAEKAAELVKTFAKLNDDEFNKLAETLAVAWKSTSATTPTQKKPEDVIRDVVNNNTHTDPPLSTASQTEAAKAEENRVKAAKFIGGLLRINNNVPVVTGEK